MMNNGLAYVSMRITYVIKISLKSETLSIRGKYWLPLTVISNGVFQVVVLWLLSNRKSRLALVPVKTLFYF